MILYLKFHARVLMHPIFREHLCVLIFVHFHLLSLVFDAIIGFYHFLKIEHAFQIITYLSHSIDSIVLGSRWFI